MKLSNRMMAAAIAAIGVSTPVAADLQPRAERQTAVNNCEAALPKFEGALRRRPLGIANEGSATVFISCGFPKALLHSTGAHEADVRLTNNVAIPVDVSCTLVSGLGGSFDPVTYFPQTIAMGRFGVDFAFWIPSMNGGNLFKDLSVSCAIPPNVEITATASAYKIDVGL